MKPSRISLITLLLVALSTSAGCGMVNRIRAKNALNEGARAYKEGNFKLAEEKFRYAYELDPSQKNAPIFIARSIQQQYRPGVDTPENRSKGEAAVSAYQEVLAQNPGNEDAYKAIVFLYRQMKNDQKEREMLIQRASLDGLAAEKRAEAYTILASKQWDCSYEITEQNKETVNRPDAVVIKYKKPADQGEFDKARNCSQEGLKLVEQAISLDPNNPNGWSYKANLLREMSKLAEMDNNTSQKDEYDKQYDQALEKHKQLTEAAQKQKEAEGGAAPAAGQPAS